MTIEFDPLALLELNDAVEYYNFKLAGLGDRFKDDVRIGISLLSKRTFKNCNRSAFMPYCFVVDRGEI